MLSASWIFHRSFSWLCCVLDAVLPLFSSHRHVLVSQNCSAIVAATVASAGCYENAVLQTGDTQRNKMPGEPRRSSLAVMFHSARARVSYTSSGSRGCLFGNMLVVEYVYGHAHMGYRLLLVPLGVWTATLGEGLCYERRHKERTLGEASIRC